MTPYAESKARSEHDLRRLADRTLLPGLPARRDRLRRLAAAALRSRGQQPGGLGRDHRPGVPEEPRHLLAAAGPHRGHRAGLHRAAARARGEGPQPRLQHRPDRGELPDQRRRRAGPPDRAGHADRVRRRRHRRTCATTGSTATGSRATLPRLPPALDGRAGHQRGLRRDRRSAGSAATTSRARATTGSPI